MGIKVILLIAVYGMFVIFIIKFFKVATKNEKVVQAIYEDEKHLEAITALQVLGYTRKEIEKAFEKLELQNLSVEEIIKKALTILGK